MRDIALAVRLWHRALRYRFKLNPREIAAMVQLLPRGGTALDVGAHKGGYAWWMARAIGPRGTVMAFEPQERVLKPSARAFSAAGMRQVQYVHAAVSDRSGEGSIAISRGSTHGASLNGLRNSTDAEQTPVRLLRLDELIEPGATAGLSRVDFIKIDVEGHELAVLRGATKLIHRFRPALLIECEARKHEGEDALAAVRAMLEALGYRGEFFTRREQAPIEQFDAARHQRYGQGYYSNNFLFQPVGR